MKSSVHAARINRKRWRRYRWFAKLKNGTVQPAKLLARRYLKLPFSDFHTYQALDVLSERGISLIYCT